MPDTNTVTAPAAKLARKFYAHFLDASFGGSSVNYVRLGKDLEEYNEELNPEVDTAENILGEMSVNHKGYKPQSEVSPYYVYEDDPLCEKLWEIINERKTADGCMTTKVDVLLDSTGTVEWAYREDVLVVPTSAGGDTSGVQIPFTIYSVGNRVAGSFNISTKTFTPASSTSGSSTP